MRRIPGAVLLLLAALSPGSRADSDRLPIFDAHVHYNLDIGRPLSVEDPTAV